MTEAVVAVQRGKTLQERVLSCLEDLGGIRKLVPPGKKVLIKPNLVVDKTHDSGATTNPELLKLLLTELKKTSPQELILGEGSSAHYSTERAFRVTGMDKIAHNFGARLVNLQKDSCEKISIPQGKAIKEVEVARTVLDADYLINVPVLKLHSQTRMTIALKNLKGCISDQEKKRFHRLDLDQCIADLNTILPVDLIIVDATLCALSWEGGGDPIRLDSILAGTNPAAVDTIAAPLLGYHPSEVKHLRFSAEHGLGPCEREKIKVIHQEKLEGLALPEELTRRPQHKISGLQVVEKGTCTPCLGSFLAAVRRLEREKSSLPITAFLGQLLEEKDLEGVNDYIGIGSCSARLVGLEKTVPGCPPEGWQIYEYFKKM